MSKFQQKFRNIQLLKFLYSLKITSVCLFLLFVLTFWGTVAQVQQGLFLAQERYFHSWYFLVWGWLPFPGARLILWILFVNLLSAAAARFVYNRHHFGILMIHLGLLMYFVAAFVTFHMVEESNLHIAEEAQGNLSQSYHEWELSVWDAEQPPPRRTVRAYDLHASNTDIELDFPALPFGVRVEKFYPNVKAYTAAPSAEQDIYINDSGIRSMVAVPSKKEREENIPGAIVIVTGDSGEEKYPLLLYGAEDTPTQLRIGSSLYNFQLRRQRHELPFRVELIDVEREVHPGTETASRYESRVRIHHEGLEREVRIYMNNPFRYKDYTLYQASYAIDGTGREYSTFAVVRNAGRMLPYVASLWTFAGLLFHFIQASLRYRGKQKRRGRS